MYLTRPKLGKSMPLPRKGTKYIARAASFSKKGISVVVAVRDILGLARTSKEVNLMIKEKKLKLNGKEIRDLKEGIAIFSILEAGDKYRLTILETGKFSFEKVKDDSRIAKVVGKKTLSGKKVQINLHDGTNLMGDDNVKVGDSVVLGLDGKMKEIKKMDKGKSVFIISGRNVGKEGKILETDGKMIKVKLEDREIKLEGSHVIVI